MTPLAGLPPDELWRDAWARWIRATRDRRHGFRHPVIATWCARRGARARSVVLRSADPASDLLLFHTDLRSAKVAELRADPRASWCFYDPRPRLQLRAETRATLHVGDDVARAAWERQGGASRAVYAAEPAPGGPLPRNAPAPRGDGFANFVVVTCRLEALDWLLLGSPAHRRLCFRRRDSGDWQGHEVVP